MWTKFVLRGVGVLALAFILTSAMMFWLPIIERFSGFGYYDVGGYYGGYYSYGGYDGGYYSYGGYGGVFGGGYIERDLKKLSPADELELLNEISAELRKKTNAALYQMKAFAEVCANNLVNCRGLESTKVKPFIDAILSDRQTAESAMFSVVANFISAGSLFVSFVALIFTSLSYRRKRAGKSTT